METDQKRARSVDCAPNSSFSHPPFIAECSPIAGLAGARIDHLSFELALVLLLSSLGAGQKMKPLVLLACFVTLMSMPGYAQPPVSPSRSAPEENVTVTGFRSREVLDKFVKSFATPTRMTGKIARWENGVCPLTVGQSPDVTKFVTQWVKDVAAVVGAPVNANQSCTPNIEIVFTTTPQALLDNIREHETDYLGYAESGPQIEKLATVTRPVQAWYTTQTKDLQGMSRIDSARRRGEGIIMPCFTCLPCADCLGQNSPPEYLPDATYASVTGNHISDGARSVFYHIIIVADPSKLARYEIGPLADYIAMLALTQLNSLDTCQPLLSIVNMLAPGCERKTSGITEYDVAYLRGLYQMSLDRRLPSQQGEIANRMSETLRGQ
ncbi:MAG TPA: hypothetical protein VKB94_03815 [Rhizomicrobium sp.]|nr:hypothetical protein [Rhizomicrobium sp.]